MEPAQLLRSPGAEVVGHDCKRAALVALAAAWEDSLLGGTNFQVLHRCEIEREVLYTDLRALAGMPPSPSFVVSRSAQSDPTAKSKTAKPPGHHEQLRGPWAAGGYPL